MGIGTKAYIELADSKSRTFKIDLEDWDKIKAYCWNVSTWLVKRKTCPPTIKQIVSSGAYSNKKTLHRFLMGAEKHQIVDHINGDVTDNRKENLRFVTISENNRNRKARGNSKYKGVHFCNTKKNFCASINFNGDHLTLGRFKNEIEAARAYDRFCIENNISCARLNNV